MPAVAFMVKLLCDSPLASYISRPNRVLLVGAVRLSFEVPLNWM